jgi:hypothetical protein
VTVADIPTLAEAAALLLLLGRPLRDQDAMTITDIALGVALGVWAPVWIGRECGIFSDECRKTVRLQRWLNMGYVFPVK